MCTNSYHIIVNRIEARGARVLAAALETYYTVSSIDLSGTLVVASLYAHC